MSKFLDGWCVGDHAEFDDCWDGMAGYGGYRYRSIMAGEVEVARVWCDEDDAEQHAAVRLIAAAPELLRACREMAEVIASMSDGGAAPYLEIIRMAEGKA